MNEVAILTRSELAQVLNHLDSLSSTHSHWVNRVIFRLSACCGLRAKEISGLDCGDLIVTGERPVIRIRKEITKGENGKRKQRLIPLWWDGGTCRDLTYWLKERRENGATPHSPFATHRDRITTRSIARRWSTAISCLPEERVDQLHLHCGRHTFISHALFGGRSLVEVQRAAGHASVNTTSLYLHIVERDGVADLFNFEEYEDDN